jgi:chemotaxis protein histidine kinase CheA
MHSGETRVALQIDDLSANREVAVKSAGSQFADLPGVASATIKLSDAGRPSAVTQPSSTLLSI